VRVEVGEENMSENDRGTEMGELGIREKGEEGWGQCLG
jgi:hypothetical protein